MTSLFSKSYFLFIFVLFVQETCCLWSSWIKRFPISNQKLSSVASEQFSSSTVIRNERIFENFDYKVEDKLPWNPSGYKWWNWNGYKINYIDMGGDESKPPLLLIHGFGASVFHWRYNIPALARKYHVFAIDLLGFGLSDKPLITYTVDVWRDQVLDFIQSVVRKSTNLPVTVAGNSLGGFTALSASSAQRSNDENLIKGCILLNAAGRFRPPDSEPMKRTPSPLFTRISSIVQRAIIWVSFFYTKQPSRINQVLRSVYSVDPSNVDEELVESIRLPSLHPDAAEVFYRIITQNGNGPREYVDDLLNNLKVPLLLLWGMKDPWIRPNAAEKIKAAYPQAELVEVDAGHCPHDENPKVVNDAIIKFMEKLY